MSLRSKFLIRNWGLVLGLILVGGASLWGLEGLRRQVTETLAAYDDLATIGSAGTRLSLARQTINAPNPDVAKSIGLIRQSAEAAKVFIVREASSYDVRYARGALASMHDAESAIEQGSSSDATSALDVAIDQIDRAAQSCRVFIETNDKAAGQRLRYTVLTIGIIFAMTLAVATFSSIRQYQTIMLPLQRLREGVARVSTAEFSGKVEERGDREFVELAAEFNQMAGELDSFYKKLEEKVVEKSRDLVRSERMASVGFLAAGVAHEINNPLNIISGYAELAQKRLTAGSDLGAINDTLQVLRVIRSESFRCKEITEKLLSLAKGGSENREPLALDNVARDVAVLARGLKEFGDRQIELGFKESLDVVANATEMKQMLLNLTVNALQAVRPGDGKVWIEGRRVKDWVELSVRDNGPGIQADSIQHVFEPFYSRRVGSRPPGTGLGLSITHAIVENHGGRIRAESAGAGQGSRFTVELPAVKREKK